jgi:hypothetical protein
MVRGWPRSWRRPRQSHAFARGGGGTSADQRLIRDGAWCQGLCGLQARPTRDRHGGDQR